MRSPTSIPAPDLEMNPTDCGLSLRFRHNGLWLLLRAASCGTARRHARTAVTPLALGLAADLALSALLATLARRTKRKLFICHTCTKEMQRVAGIPARNWVPQLSGLRPAAPNFQGGWAGSGRSRFVRHSLIPAGGLTWDWRSSTKRILRFV